MAMELSSWGTQEKMHRALLSMPDPGVQSIFVPCTLLPTPYGGDTGSGKLADVSYTWYFFYRAGRLSPQARNRVLGPLQPQCLAEPSQREDVPLVQGKQGHTRSAPVFKGSSVRKLFFMFP